MSIITNRKIDFEGSVGKMSAENLQKYTPMCTRKDIATLWNTTSNNIGKTYATKGSKQIQYQMIDMGAFCVMNSIDAEMLELLVRFGNEFKNRFHDMTEADIQEFNEFKKFKLFNEAQK